MSIQASPQVEINLNGKQGDAWIYLNDNVTTEIFYGGAAGGGKSFEGCLWHIDRRIRYPGTRGMIGRAEISTLEQSTLKTFFDVADLMGHHQGSSFFYNQQKHFISWANGSETYLKDLVYKPSDPDFASLGSTEYTDVFIDEGTEIKLKAFDIANSRIRYKLKQYNLVPKIFVTCNPSPGWIKDNYITDPITNLPIVLKDYQKFIRALVTDNPDKDFVKLYSQQLSRMHSEYDRLRLLEGDWEVEPGSKNPFAFQFNPYYHVSSDAVYRRDRRLYISIDFNLNPFAVTFWHYWQDQLGYHLHGIDEAEIATGSIPAMIELIKNRHGDALFNAILTGDSMGNHRDIGRVDNASHYIEMIKGLGMAESQLQVPHNPTHENSRADCNSLLFESKQPETRIHVKLHPERMKMTIKDLKLVQCDAFGQIIKRNRTDLSQRADYLDGFRAIVNLVFKKLLVQYRNI